jgi:two-component sensor histidine kinase
MPRGHVPVKSYLAVPVKSRSGEVIGGLFFGHRRAGVFSERAEGLVVGIAAQAAIAIDNARLYQAAQTEIAERRRAETHQRLLMNELNHRVKNTLATVQSMGSQTLRTGRSLAEAREAFDSRIMALSAAHNLLTAERWESADLEDVVRVAVAPFDEPAGTRFSVTGPGVRLKASNALGLAMALQELGANAVRHGALSAEDGRVDVSWTLAGGAVEFTWAETGGPAVTAPLRRGFGSRLIQEGLSRELQGEVRMDFLPEGLRCVLTFPLDAPPETDPDLAEDLADLA